MKAIGFSKRQPSQSILRLILALVISGIVPVVGMSAGMSTRQNENPSAMRVTGIVTDTQCGSTHGSKTHGDAECTRLCVKLGAESSRGGAQSLCPTRSSGRVEWICWGQGRCYREGGQSQHHCRRMGCTVHGVGIFQEVNLVLREQNCYLPSLKSRWILGKAKGF